MTHRIVYEPYPPLAEHAPGLPDAVTQILDRALAKDPAERYDHGTDLAADLRAVYAAPASPTATAAVPAQRSGLFLDAPAAASQIPTGAVAAVPPADNTVVGEVPTADATIANAAPAPATTAATASARDPRTGRVVVECTRLL